jgi:hypothetical protein
VDIDPITMGPTWRNNRVGVKGVSKRLDRFLVSNIYRSWMFLIDVLIIIPLYWNRIIITLIQGPLLNITMAGARR